MNKDWQKTKTTRVYLHPPKSERMYTLWREGKLIFGEIEPRLRDYWDTMTSSGIWFVDGEGRQLDFRKSEYVVREDGIPIHTLKNKIGDLELSLECFATPERKSACYFKLTLVNPTDVSVCEKVGFVLRTGKESNLVFGAPDVYYSYAPALRVWMEAEATWTEEKGVYRDGLRTIKSSGDMDFCFDSETGVAMAAICLAPGECCQTVFAYQIGDFELDSFEEKKAETIRFWETELARIARLPAGIREDPHRFNTVRNLTAQILQCICYPVGQNCLLARQGGLQRQVWTYESLFALEALSRLGEFEDYIEPVIDHYFTEFWTETGEVVPLGNHWAMNTGTVLYTFGQYAMTRGKQFYDKYRNKAMKSFEWMRKTRSEVKESETMVAGLFPPMSSCDDPLAFQSWTNTDAMNVICLKQFLRACEFFADTDTPAVRREYEDYRDTMRRNWQRISDAAATADEIAVPVAPKECNVKVGVDFIFNAPDAFFVDAIDMDEADVQRIMNYNTRRGIYKEGLYDRMPDLLREEPESSMAYNYDENGISRVWYVCCHEYNWFRYFKRHGMLDRCAQILEYNERYAMTTEGYMYERYHERDPYFAPWMPNASANGRTIMMMLDYFEE